MLNTIGYGVLSDLVLAVLIIAETGWLNFRVPKCLVGNKRLDDINE